MATRDNYQITFIPEGEDEVRKEDGFYSEHNATAYVENNFVDAEILNVQHIGILNV
jgi:hypothetical protein